MSNAIAVIPPRQQLTLTNEDLNILKNSKFKGFTDAEVSFAAKIVSQLNLSPFLNQIHFVKRKLKDGTSAIATQVGIDGFRLSAQRAGGYAGSDEPAYSYDEKSQGEKYPAKASITVYKIVQGARCPFSASARWDEYFPGAGPNSHMWDKMPHTMLSKCAEALALRKAFPAELSSMYVEEEMHQADAKTSGGVFPEQPSVEDGVHSASYIIPYGPLAKQAIEDADPVKLRDYINEIEAKAKRMGKPVPPWGLVLIKEAEPLIAAFENGTPEE